MQLLDLKAANHVASPPKLDDVILCGSCGNPNVITVAGTRLMTEAEFNKMHPDELRDLDFAKRAIQRKVRQS